LCQRRKVGRSFSTAAGKGKRKGGKDAGASALSLALLREGGKTPLGMSTIVKKRGKEGEFRCLL